MNTPSVDVLQHGNDIIVTADMPGVDKNDIRINVRDDRILEISAQKKMEKTEEEKTGFLRRERRYMGYYRSITLPAPVDKTKAKASYNNGVLTVTLPDDGRSRRKRRAKYRSPELAGIRRFQCLSDSLVDVVHDRADRAVGDGVRQATGEIVLVQVRIRGAVVRAMLVAGAQVIFQERARHPVERPAIVLVVPDEIVGDDAIGRYSQPLRQPSDVLVVQQRRDAFAAACTLLTVESGRFLPVQLVDDDIDLVRAP